MSGDNEATVHRAALDVWTAEGVDIWYDAPNPWLHNATPRQYVEAGDIDKVLQLIEQLVTGAFT